MLGRVLFAFLLLTSLNSYAAKDIYSESYNKARILLSRFGEKESQDLFLKALQIRERSNKVVVGQDSIAAALQIRMTQYLNSLGSRKEEPIAMHMIGLPGVGKTSLLQVLEDLKFPVIRIDAEKYPGGENSPSSFFLMQALQKAISLQTQPNMPLILFIDELDKVPEKLSNGEEMSQPVLSALNEILSEGKLSNPHHSGATLNFSNVMILTAMNFAPSQIETFSQEILGEKKTFWNFTEPDMISFDRWIRTAPTSSGAVASVLALLFRSNTISRLIPDAIVAKALFGDDYDRIVEMNIKTTIDRLTQDKSLALKADYTKAFQDFLRSVAVLPASGARMSVKRVDLLVEQLISMATHSDLESPETLALPRNITLDYDAAKNNAVVTIKALRRKGALNEIVRVSQLDLPYNFSSGSFELSKELTTKSLPPKLATMATDFATRQASKRVSATQIRARRLALKNDHELETHLNSIIFDQPELAHDLDRELALYMKSDEEAVRYQTIVGFTGTGKTAIAMAAAAKLDIPVVKLNMQEYSADNQEAADRFGEDLFEKVQEAVSTSKNGKYLLLIEEIDKTFEVDPTTGQPVTGRPVISYVKDLLRNGVRTVTLKNGFSGSVQKVIDIRGGYTVLTMNFTIDRFDLKADPRLTTVEDMEHVWGEISSSPEAIRGIFKSMFLPDTMNRLISNNLRVARPLSRNGYKKLLEQQVQKALRELSSDSESKINHGGLSVKMSKSYLDNYLFAESVIPSEGGSQASQTARALIRSDVIDAVQALPKGSPLFNKPIEIVLDFKPKSARSGPRVVASARLSDKRDIAKANRNVPIALFDQERSLRFPPVTEFGQLSPFRTLVSIHEFGHAFAAVMLGSRFEFAVAVSPQPGVGGFVKWNDSEIGTAASSIAGLVRTIGSRAMERVILSSNPLAKNAELKISTGSSSDVGHSTKEIWNLIYQLGFDPNGGVIERSGLGGPERDQHDLRPYFFSELSDEKVSQLGLIVRDMEDHLVEQMLKIHDQNWYITRITDFGRRGVLTEQQFYSLINYQFPGHNDVFLGEELSTNSKFKGTVKPEPELARKARDFKQGDAGKTAFENMNETVKAFEDSVQLRLHGSGTQGCEKLLEI